MEKYIQYLKMVNLYFHLLNIEEMIENYNKASIRNQDESQVFFNLIKRKSELQNELCQLLEENHILSINNLKESILMDWEEISKLLISNQVDFNANYKGELPLYGSVQLIVHKKLEFKDIYTFLIENGLYNPNIAVGISDEPFFTMLPVNPISEFRKLNKKVIMDTRTDFHIYKNGMDIIQCALDDTVKSETQEEKEYWKEYIFWSLQGNCSLLDSKRLYSQKGIRNDENTPNIYDIFSTDYELDSIREYLLTEEGIRKQVNNALYPSVERDKAIDFYIAKIGNKEILKRQLIKLKTN